MTRILRAALTDGEISLTEHERLVAGDAAGAVVGFAGIVRNHDGGREVLRLEYSAHPHAEQILNKDWSPRAPLWGRYFLELQ
jgi:molybdopterin synthase catalytic subunit